jgi:hypothetical protein
MVEALSTGKLVVRKVHMSRGFSYRDGRAARHMLEGAECQSSGGPEQLAVLSYDTCFPFLSLTTPCITRLWLHVYVRGFRFSNRQVQGRHARSALVDLCLLRRV